MSERRSVFERRAKRDRKTEKIDEPVSVEIIQQTQKDWRTSPSWKDGDPLLEKPIDRFLGNLLDQKEGKGRGVTGTPPQGWAKYYGSGGGYHAGSNFLI